MLAEVLATVSIYSQLPLEELEGEILAICHHNVTTFLRSVQANGLIEEPDLSQIAASAARRAEERISLAAVLGAYQAGALAVWERAKQEAQPGEEDELLALAGFALSYIGKVTTLVAQAYGEESEAIAEQERDARRALAQALLTGNATEPLAQRAGVSLAPSYIVAALWVGPSPDETMASSSSGRGSGSGIASSVAVRRKLRRLEHTLASQAGEDALGLWSPSGATLLLPLKDVDPQVGQQGVATIVNALAESSRASITAGVAVGAGREGTLDAHREATQVLELARALGRPSGCYVLEDLLFEHMVYSGSAGARRIGAVLAPISHKPLLMETLGVYLDQRRDRRQAALVLNIHPNTLDYRLRRICELTGLDVASSHDMALMQAAIVALRIEALGEQSGD